MADLTIDTMSHEVRRGARAIDLTAQEFNLLVYLIRHTRQVLSREQVLQGVWGLGSGITCNLVDVHIAYVRQKLEAAGEPRILHTVRDVGFVLRSD